MNQYGKLLFKESQFNLKVIGHKMLIGWEVEKESHSYQFGKCWTVENLLLI